MAAVKCRACRRRQAAGRRAGCGIQTSQVHFVFNSPPRVRRPAHSFHTPLLPVHSPSIPAEDSTLHPMVRIPMARPCSPPSPCRQSRPPARKIKNPVARESLFHSPALSRDSRVSLGLECLECLSWPLSNGSKSPFLTLTSLMHAQVSQLDQSALSCLCIRTGPVA